MQSEAFFLTTCEFLFCVKEIVYAMLDPCSSLVLNLSTQRQVVEQHQQLCEAKGCQSCRQHNQNRVAFSTMENIVAG